MSDMSSSQNLPEAIEISPAPIESVGQIEKAASESFRREALLWIAEQARRGVPGEALHQALVGRGWNSDAAGFAIQSAVTEFCPGYILNPDVKNFHQFPVPEPLMPGNERQIVIGDQIIEIAMSCVLPRIVVFDNFLTSQECAKLIELATPRMERSSVVQPVSGASMINEVRTSTGMFFQVGENDLVKAIEERIARLLYWPVENGEGIQVLNYQTGAEYKPHQDYFDPADAGTPKQVGLAGQRVGTLVMYLNTPKRGGGTIFPDAGGLEVRAREGRAVLFSYDQPLAAKRTLHGGSPVLEGEKWAATKWLRQASFVPSGVPGP